MTIVGSLFCFRKNNGAPVKQLFFSTTNSSAIYAGVVLNGLACVTEIPPPILYIGVCG